MSGCDSGGGGEEDTRLDPDDITVRITQNTGTQRDQIKTSVTSQADEELDYIDVSLAFFDDEGAQIGQMPFVFAGRYQTGQSAEMELSLPASIMRHSAYACYRYSVGMSTSDGDFGEKDYDGTCDD